MKAAGRSGENGAKETVKITGMAAMNVTAAAEKQKIEETAGKVTEEEKAYIHWLYQAVGVGSRGFLRSLLSWGTPRELYQMTFSGALAKKVSERYTKKVTQMTEFSKGYDVEGVYGHMREQGISLVTENEPQYPKRLSRIPDKPYALYYVGRLPQEGKRAVALIGARDCTAYGRYLSEQFGAAFAKAGVQVVSGMARGIDGIGQSAALKEGGYSIGVLGCGVDICYPRDNKALYETLLTEGGICSEYPPGTEPRAVLFPPRNRIISGLGDAVLVVEAREKSGTLITVDMALEQGREVYALPGRATDVLSGGCNRLIRQGAGLVSTPEELLEELMGGTEGRLFPETKGEAAQGRLFFLEGMQGELFELLDFSPLPAQELQRRYEENYKKIITLPVLFKELLDLCAGGYAGQVGGGYFMRVMKT